MRFQASRSSWLREHLCEVEAKGSGRMTEEGHMMFAMMVVVVVR